jgi:uncharacterized delta-60 repeat protein
VYVSELVGGYNFGVARFNADGSLDNSFSSDGKTTIDFAGTYCFGNAMVLQPDGKILIAGFAVDGLDFLNGYNFAVTRLNTNGSLDNTFSGDGKTTVDFAASADQANSMILQADGKILVAGFATEAVGGSNFAISRFDADGALDTSFSGDGKTTLDFASGNDTGYAMVMQLDGKILVAGSAEKVTGNEFDFGVARFSQ